MAHAMAVVLRVGLACEAGICVGDDLGHPACGPALRIAEIHLRDVLSGDFIRGIPHSKADCTMLDVLHISPEKVSVLQNDDIVPSRLHWLRGTYCLNNGQSENSKKGKNLLHIIRIKVVTRPK